MSTPPRLTAPVTERDHHLGPLDAPIVLVEYGDYACNACRKIPPIIEQLQSYLGDDLCYVFRHFPLTTVHASAKLAAEAAEAAAAQGRFWEMHDRLFRHRGPLALADVLAYARELGLDAERMRRELEDETHAETIQEQFASGIRSGANRTPTFYVNGERYDGAWDLESLLAAVAPRLGGVQTLVQEFARLEASGGIVLLICAVLALVWANSPWAQGYFHLWEQDWGVVLGDASFVEHLLHLVNDGLMVIFFLVVGLEIKREVTSGELASVKQAALPVAAAIGGMVLPAAIYLAFNAGTPGADGWGIPVATDIAFTLGILALLGRRVPLSLKVFFTALAIADDLGAVLVIALFYTADISWLALGAAGVIFLVLLGLNRARVYRPWPYMVLGVFLWLAFLQSGVHPTLAGVLLALAVPTRSPANTYPLMVQGVTLLEGLDRLRAWEAGDEADGESQLVRAGRHQAAVQTLETITDRLQSPARRLEHDLHPWTTYVILPLFALANAGVVLGSGLAEELVNPVTLGIIAGLVLGKPVGIMLFSWAAVRLGWASLPGDIGWGQFFAASWLAGIGFTMSLFIASAAFADAGILAAAKLGTLVASLLAALVGLILLSRFSPDTQQATTLTLAPATD